MNVGPVVLNQYEAGMLGSAVISAATAFFMGALQSYRQRRVRSAQEHLAEAQAELAAMEAMRERLKVLARQVDELTEKIQRHLAWDEAVAQRLAALGQPVPPRPPL